MDEPSDESEGPLKVPLFPLPNVVLFPRAVLPLYVFEERYKRMIADAMEGDRRIAMALLQPGWEKDYYCRPPIEPVVCVGRIIANEKSKSGEYTLLLQGQMRAVLQNETGGRPSDPTPYRVATVQPLPETAAMEIDLAGSRQDLRTIFSHASLGVPGKQLNDLFTGPMSTAQIADLVAFRFLEDIRLKQALLAEADVVRRVERIVREVRSLRELLPRPRRTFQPGLN